MTSGAPATQRFIIGVFLFLAAVVCAVAPLPLAFRSAGILFFSYLSFAVGGSAAAHFTALLAPPIGLLSGDPEWLIMLPVVLACNLLAMIGLEFAWRYAALLVSPLLQAIPQLVIVNLSDQELFAVDLPWEPRAQVWIALHILTALAGVLVAVYLDRRRERQAVTA
ncbi:MAG TPA: hypothetical protein VF168_02685 [Trueperaceae bacterium]